MTNRRIVLANVVLFQVAWFACVLSAADHVPWVGASIVAVVVGVHILQADRPIFEAALIVGAGLIGAVWESALVTFAGFRYPSGMWSASAAPYWIIAMWLLFATTVNVSLRWLKHRWVLSALLGGIGGPLSFYAGYRLGAVRFEDLGLAMLMLSAGWAVLVPALMAISTRLDGMESRFNAVQLSAAT